VNSANHTVKPGGGGPWYHRRRVGQPGQCDPVGAGWPRAPLLSVRLTLYPRTFFRPPVVCSRSESVVHLSRRGPDGPMTVDGSRA